MQITKTHKIIISIIAVAILLGIYILFDKKSKQQNHPTNTVPAGFKGYTFRNTGISGSTSPNIYYKTQYFSGDSTFKTYLGVSELGYTGHTAGRVSISQSVKTIEHDLWSYIGATPSGTTTVKGFHLESVASTNHVQ